MEQQPRAARPGYRHWYRHW